MFVCQVAVNTHWGGLRHGELKA